MSDSASSEKNVPNVQLEGTPLKSKRTLKDKKAAFFEQNRADIDISINEAHFPFLAGSSSTKSDNKSSSLQNSAKASRNSGLNSANSHTGQQGALSATVMSGAISPWQTAYIDIGGNVPMTCMTPNLEDLEPQGLTTPRPLVIPAGYPNFPQQRLRIFEQKSSCNIPAISMMTPMTPMSPMSPFAISRVSPFMPPTRAVAALY
jgi:hypothetical protein